MTKYCTGLLMLIILWPSFAADPNGYSARYECRAGGPNCNVDVVTLTQQACQQTITTATTPINSWSAINWSNNVICIEAGNHTGRGTLTLGSNGTSENRKVLRYYRAGDNDDDPWNQSAANRAVVDQIDPNGKSYWIFHRLSMTNNKSVSHITIPTTSSYIIVNRMYLKGIGGSGDNAMIWINGAPHITIQNSVLGPCQLAPNYSYRGIDYAGAYSALVNNEIFNCNKPVATLFSTPKAGVVIENNDIYTNNSTYTNCAGNPTTSGACGISKVMIGAESGSNDSSNPVQIIQNRVWGGRKCDTNVGCSGGGGNGDAIGGGYWTDLTWILIQNNLVFDQDAGITLLAGGPGVVTSQNSIIGNLIYDIKRTTAYESYAINGSDDHNEAYLNTIIRAKGTQGIGATGSYSGHRCNVFIDSSENYGTGTGVKWDYNVYYGTPDMGETNKISKTLNTRANSTAYSLNQVIRTTASPPADGTSGDFLYIVRTAGTSASSAPNYCTKLGCISNDGTMTVQAIRGPHSFKRKLRTIAGGETVFIPYARVHVAAPETGGCLTTTGS